jgi:hypothetical protein
METCYNQGVVIKTVEFTNLLEVHSPEFPKLLRDADGTPLYDRARFSAAETEEELDMIAKRNQTISRAVVKLRELSADERARDLHERREKERRDENMRERWAVKQREFEFAKNLLEMNLSLDQIIAASGLTREEIEGLRQ